MVANGTGTALSTLTQRKGDTPSSVKIKTKVVLEIREGMSPINSAPTTKRLASDRTSGTAKAVSPLVSRHSPVTLASPIVVTGATQVVRYG